MKDNLRLLFLLPGVLCRICLLLGKLWLGERPDGKRLPRVPKEMLKIILDERKKKKKKKTKKKNCKTVKGRGGVRRASHTIG